MRSAHLTQVNPTTSYRRSRTVAAMRPLREALRIPRQLPGI
jgi:hypothetical protein